MRNASICEGPCRSQLPGALARAMPARGGKNEIGTDAPTKSRLARIRPRHNKEIEQLRVTESGAGRCTLTQRLGFDLKGGPNELFQIQWPAGINRKDTAKGQCVWFEHWSRIRWAY